MELIFLFLPITISFLLSVKLLFFSKKGVISYRFLGLYFLFLTLVLSSVLLQYQKQFHPELIKYIISVSVVFYVSIVALPVTVYLYVKTLTRNVKFSVEKLVQYYSVPILLLLINISSVVYLSFDVDPNEVNIDFCKKIWNGANFASLIFVFPILTLFYLYKSFKIYFEYRRKIKEVFSYNEGVNLKWMLIFLLGYLFYVISFIALDQDSSPIFVYVPMLMYLLFVGIMGMKQNEVLFEEDINDLNKGDFGLEKNKELKEKVLLFMKKEEPFLDNELTIYQLAKMLGTNTKYLSSLLNNDFNMSFTAFINSYRIDKSKELLLSLEIKHYTIEVIGEMSGFKSKSAFNRWFKEFTSVTPSIYRSQ